MPAKTLYLFYAAANQDLATEVMNHFENTQVQLIANPSTETFKNAIEQSPNSQVLLLVTDNLLCSTDIMERLGDYIQEPLMGLIPVLTDGRRMRPDNNVYELVATKIGTIHEVMKYRDFWYEEWIRLRKRCNDAAPEDLEALENQKNIAKRMSTNIGTFLRSINSLNPLSWDALTENDFQVLLDRLNIDKLYTPSSHINVFKEEEKEDATEIPLFNKTVVPETVVPETTEEEYAPVSEEALENETSSELEESEHIEADYKELPESEGLDALETHVEPVEEPAEEEEETEFEENIEVSEVEPVSMELEQPRGLEEVEEELVTPVTVELEEEPFEIEEMNKDSNTDFELVESPVEDTNPSLEELTEPIQIHQEEPVKEETFAMRGLDHLDDYDDKAVYDNVKVMELTDLDVLFYLAESESEESRFENARQCYERILHLDPANGRAMLWLARLLDKHFEGEEASVENLYKRAMLCNEESATIYYEYALLLKNRFGAKHRAADLLARAIEMNPRFEQAYLEMAECQKSLGRIELAKANYLQACILNDQIQNAESDASYGVYREVVAVQTENVAEAVMAQPQNPNADTVVMVTGATSGIGKAVAEIFAINGYKVIVTGRRNDRLEEFKEQLESKFMVDIQSLCFDVRNAEEMKKALESLPEAWRNVDILINNAGLAKGLAPIHEGDLMHWETMIDTNVKGLLYLTRAIAPSMVERKKGFIINLGSAAAKDAYPNGNVYCASKAAVDMLTKGMRMDLLKHGIRVAAIHPGHVETEFAEVRFDGDKERAKIYEDFTPLTAYDVAETIYYVATRPAHVDIQDILMTSTQQANTNLINRSGKM